ncbi:hypothetical protein QCA50_007128 [Cerrena zonata]|uniref:Uncharacterized protein n=1 Tax=Cerrena zonata TaxID=2478898 RepID=A0AAW0GHD3_9APHY
MVQTTGDFTESCYLVRLEVHIEASLKQMDDALSRFHQARETFLHTGVRPDGFDSLPHQHSLKHQMAHIRNFGALNGLCTSIMKSRHIKAVKEPWRRSNRFAALSQVLLTNRDLISSQLLVLTSTPGACLMAQVSHKLSHSFPKAKVLL